MARLLVLQRFQLREELQLTLTILVQEHKLQELSLVWQLVLTPSQLRMVTTVPLMCQLLLQNLLPLLVL